MPESRKNIHITPQDTEYMILNRKIKSRKKKDVGEFFPGRGNYPQYMKIGTVVIPHQDCKMLLYTVLS